MVDKNRDDWDVHFMDSDHSQYEAGLINDCDQIAVSADCWVRSDSHFTLSGYVLKLKPHFGP